MNTFPRKMLLFLSLVILSIPLAAQTIHPAEVKAKIIARFEHIAINVPDPVAAVTWYTANLGMKVVRPGTAPTFTTFIADSGTHMMMEIFHNADYPLLDPAKIHHMAIHLAFITPNIVQTKERLTKAGAVIVDSLRKTSSGDQVMTLRDPWGLPLQFVERVKPMLAFTGLFPEHFAMNIEDVHAKLRWYNANLGMVSIKEGSAPTYGSFIADAGKNMMFELYQNKEYPAVDFAALHYMSLHVAFMVEDIQAVKVALLAAGAKVAEEIRKTPAGDTVMMMRDPWGLPIQFVQRASPMLK